MYELYRYILPVRKTNFNPFRLAAAYALCSPPSPASGDGFHKVSALPRGIYQMGGWERVSARDFFPSLRANAPFGRIRSRQQALRAHAPNSRIGSETARFSDGKARSRKRA